jgi:hypothetical protein
MVALCQGVHLDAPHAERVIGEIKRMNTVINRWKIANYSQENYV